jgi:hypothetical protein
MSAGDPEFADDHLSALLRDLHARRIFGALKVVPGAVSVQNAAESRRDHEGLRLSPGNCRNTDTLAGE